MDTVAIREARPRPRSPIITDDDRARIDRYLLLNDFQPSSRALSAPCRAPRGDWYGTALGAEQAALAHEFTEVHGRGDDFYSIPVSNGTRAISLTLTALAVHADRLGLRRPRAGDNVIVPALTWPATATAALAVGFAPRLADVRADTLGIDPDSARGLIDNRTFAIVAVHLYHRLADIDELAAIAASRCTSTTGSPTSTSWRPSPQSTGSLLSRTARTPMAPAIAAGRPAPGRGSWRRRGGGRAATSRCSSTGAAAGSRAGG